MKELEFLHYRPGSSLWHRHDPRLKLLELAFWSVLALAADPLVMATIAIILVVLHGASGTRVRQMRKPLMFWFVMALAIVVTAGLSDKTAPLIVAGRALPLGRTGLISGALRAARLLTILLAGQLLAATTDPADLAGAVRKVTFFLPPSWSGTLATAISLTLAFIPQILDEAATIRDAAFSRGLGGRRSVFRRALTLGLPMAEATIRRADVTTEALLSRCYTHNPSSPDLKIKPFDVTLTMLVVFPPAAVTLIVVFL